MDRNERTVASACGIMRLDGFSVPKTVADSILRCLNDEAVFDFAVIYVAGARAEYRTMHRIGRSAEDPYCYEDTRTPVNRLNIRDGDALKAKIRDIIPIRIAELEMHPITRPVSADYVRLIHKRLYSDIVSWAGEYRLTDCPDLPEYCRAVYIRDCMDDLFSELEKEDYLSAAEDLTGRLAHYMCELLAIRPFRIGNGVTARVFINILAVMNGRYLDYSKASASLTDIAVRHGIAGDISHLKDILDGIINDY